MKHFILSILFLAACGVAGAQTIHLLGDSTMSPKNLSGGNIERGWGMMLPDFLDDSISVINYARGGRSTKSTIDNGRWDECKSNMKPGDYLFMQFGHNDKKIEDPSRYAAPFGAYQDNLRLFCRTAIEMGVTPVILTPVYRRWFNDGVLDPNCHGDYPEAARQVAKELGVTLIDMTAITYQWLIDAGEESSKEYFCWFEAGKYECHPAARQDNTHFSIKGAKKMAELVCSTFPELLPELAMHLVHYDIVIAPDGSGDFFTVQEALSAMPDTLRNGSLKILLKQGTAK